MGDIILFNTLEAAIATWDLGAVERILEDNPTINLNTTEYFLRSVLHFAVQRNNIDIVRCLLKYGASPEIKGAIGGDTPLHWAVKDGASLDIVKALLNAIPNPEYRVRYLNLPNDLGKTALHCSGRTFEPKKGEYDIIKYLVGIGADTNLLDAAGFSPAHYIAAQGSPDALRALLEEAPMAIYKEPGALAKGKSCLHLAAKFGVRGITHDDNLDWLLDHAWPDHVRPNMIRDRDDANMTAWEAAWDSINIHRVEEIAAFVLKDKRNNTMNRMFDWRFHAHRLPKPSYYSLHCNTAPGIFSLMRHLKKQKEISTEAFRRFSTDFGNLDGRESIYRVREARCVFDTIQASKYTRKFSEKIESEDMKSEALLALKSKGRAASDVVSANIDATSSNGAVPEFLSIVMPFFHRQNLGQTRLWRNPEKRKEVFTAAWEHCLSESPETFGVYMSLTLDEYCNPALTKSVLEKRNNDQVFTRIMRLKAKQGASDTNKDMLELIAVGQAWLWNIENTYIISPHTYFDEVFEGLVVGDWRIGSPPSSSHKDILRTIGCSLTYLIESLERPELWSSLPYSIQKEPILNAFEKAVTLVVEDVNNYADSVGITKINIEEERNYLHQINDILEELSMIKRVLLQQEDVWKSFANNAWPEYWPNGEDGRMVVPREDWGKFQADERNEWKTIIKAQSLFEKYRRRLSQLNEDAERVERSIIIKLDLKQKHTSLQESHSTAVMSAAVLGFTIVTIIFTPLSFVMSLFALPIDQFQTKMADSGGTKTYSSSYIGKWAATTEIVSTAFAVAAIWVAIDRGMNVPLTEGILRFLTGSFTRKRITAARHNAPADVDYLDSGSSGWWREKRLDADSPPCYSKNFGSGSGETADEPTEETCGMSGLLGRLGRRKPEMKCTV